MQTLRLALRLVARDWRAGELRVLIAAIFLAVASVGTVAFFADRVKAGLAQQANLLLGADVMISGDRPLPQSFADEARTRGVSGNTLTPFLLTQLNASTSGESLDSNVGLVLNNARLAAAVAMAYVSLPIA